MATKNRNRQILELAFKGFAARFRHELSHDIYLEDILELLIAEKISKAKARESIEMRIAGNEPALPEWSADYGNQQTP